MFAEALTSGHIDLTNDKWQTAESMFEAVLKYNTNGGKPQTTPANLRTLHMDNLVVYCNYSRFKENQDCNGTPTPGTACDTSMMIDMKMSDGYNECKTGSKSANSANVSLLSHLPSAVAAAVTVANLDSEQQAWTQTLGSEGYDVASQVQVCEWYIKEVQASKVKSLADVGTKPALARGLAQVSSWFGSSQDNGAADESLARARAHTVARNDTRDPL